MLKFWVSINIVRKIIKRANVNYKMKLGIAGQLIRNNAAAMVILKNFRKTIYKKFRHTSV